MSEDDALVEPDPEMARSGKSQDHGWRRSLMAGAVGIVMLIGVVYLRTSNERSQAVSLPSVATLTQLATASRWDATAIKALHRTPPTRELIQKLSAMPAMPLLQKLPNKISQLGIIHNYTLGDLSASQEPSHKVSEIKSVHDARLSMQHKRRDIQAIIEDQHASTDRDWAVACCVFSAMLSAYNLLELDMEVRNVLYTCEAGAAGTVAGRRACTASLSKLIVTMSAFGLKLAASVATCKPEGDTKEDCACGIFDMTAALGAWAAAPSALVTGCNTDPHFVGRSPESWTNLGECIVGAEEVPRWMGRAMFFFRAASRSCPKSKTQLEKKLCLKHVSQALPHLAVGAYYLSMAVTSCEPKLDGVCAQGAVAVAAGTNAMMNGATDISVFCGEPGSRETSAAKDVSKIRDAAR